MGGGDDEDEKTTIESGWEDEASTTIEQGDVQDKIRAIDNGPATRRGNGNHVTGVTSTNANGQLDEVTVDEQRHNNLGAGLPLLTPPSTAPNVARLVITAGNDTGQALDVRPGKTYTVGRAIDNDLVLTDIAVSRKHFDLAFDPEAGWLVVDRGSGNGTVVNGNIEDQPFALASGDMIEIGNTVFRFDAPNAVAPAAKANGKARFALDVDEEPSTVAGKQPAQSKAREAMLEDEGGDSDAFNNAPTRSPPISSPPPPAGPPVSLRPKTQPPPPPMRARTQSSMPASFAAVPSLPQPRSVSPSAPPLAQPPAGAPMMTTLPGQAMGGMMPNQPNQQQMLHQLVSQHANVRPVSQPPPMGMPMQNGMQMPMGSMTGMPGMGMQPQSHMPFGYPQHVGDPANPHMVVPGLQRDATSTSIVPPTPYNGVPVASPATQIGLALSRRTKLAIAGAGLALLAAIVTVAIVKSGKSEAPPAPTREDTAAATTQGSAEPQPAKKPDVAVAKAPTVTPIAPPQPTLAIKKDPPPAPPPPKVEPTPTPAPPPPTIAKKADPAPTPVVEKKKDPPPVVVEKKKEPPPVVVEKKKDPPPVVEKKAKPDVVASAGRDIGPAKAKAADQFRSKSFTAAATTLRAAASGASPSDAKELKSLASTYEQFGRHFNAGMAPGAKPTDAYQELKTAKNFDSEGAFAGEIKSRLGEVAAKAAGLYVARKEYEAAYTAANDAEAYGGSTGTTQAVKKQLESVAQSLYDQANREMGSDPDGAKAKAQQILKMVSPKSAVAAKAKKLLNS